MTDTTGRCLPNRRMRRYMLAIQDVMGRSGLATILRQAGLTRYAANLPPADHEAAMTGGELAALFQAIENYYGRGARGTLNRIGHAAFQHMLSGQPVRTRFYALAGRVLFTQSRQLLALNWLAADLAAPRGQVRVQRRDLALLILEDAESDACLGRTRDTPICWVTLGEIQEATRWITDVEHTVTETACKAQGAPACRFEIGDPLLG